jgi:hypothetical protein
MLEPTFALAAPDEPPGWTIDERGLRWVGAADEPQDVKDGGDAAPLLRFELGRTRESAPLFEAIQAGDPHAIEPFVGRLALPAGLLSALARSCLERRPEPSLAIAEGRGFYELRWVRALGAEAVARGLVEDSCPLERYDEVLAIAPGFQLAQLVPLDNGALLLRWRDHGEPIERHRIELWRDSSARLLAELEGNADDAIELLPAVSAAPGRFAISGYRDVARRTSLWIFDDEGRLVHAGHCRLGSTPEAWSAGETTGWIHAQYDHVCFRLERPDGPPAWPNDAAPPLRAEDRPRDDGELLAPLCVLDGWLLTFRGMRERSDVTVDELRWIDLGGAREDRPRSWFQEVRAVRPGDGVVWVVTAKGVWGLHPERDPIFRWGHSPGAVDAAGDQIWFSFHNQVRREQGVLAVDLPTSGERWRVLLDERPAKLLQVPGGAIACGERWFWIRDDGTVGRSRPGFERLKSARLGDTTVIASGRDLLFLDGAGSLRRHLELACAIELVGVCGELALIEPEDASHLPEGFWLFDADGRLAARLPDRRPEHNRASMQSWAWQRRPQDAGLLTAHAAYLRTDRLLRWPARAIAAGGRSVFPPSQKVQRGGTRQRQYEPGLSVQRQTFYGVDCELVGDDGQAALVGSDGAVVTLVRSILRGGSIELSRGATAILIDCLEEEPDDAFVDATSYLVRVTSR